MRFLNFRKILAFTLVEVLITLGIVGVVAAIVIPTLVVNAQKQEYVSKLRKTYATLNQAFMKYAADQGCSDMTCTGLFSGLISTKQTEWSNFATNYLKVAKDCGISSGGGCFPTETYLNQAGTVTPDSDATIYKVILADGQSVGFHSYADDTLPNCTYLTTDPSNSLNRSCGVLLIDTNGAKKPNKAGRDYFPFASFAITNTHYVVQMEGSKQWAGSYCGAPCVWSDPTYAEYYCNTDHPAVGAGCASRIIEEGWQMNY